MLQPPQSAVVSVLEGLTSFRDFNDHTTNADFKTLLAAYEGLRNLLGDEALALYRKRNSRKFRQHLAAFEESLSLVETYADTSLRNIRTYASDEAKEGLPQLELAVRLMKELGRGELRKLKVHA